MSELTLTTRAPETAPTRIAPSFGQALVPGDYQVSSKVTSGKESVVLATDRGAFELDKKLVPEHFQQGTMIVREVQGHRELQFIADSSSAVSNAQVAKELLSDSRLVQLRDQIHNSSVGELEPEVEKLLKGWNFARGARRQELLTLLQDGRRDQGAKVLDQEILQLKQNPISLTQRLEILEKQLDASQVETRLGIDNLRNALSQLRGEANEVVALRSELKEVLIGQTNFLARDSSLVEHRMHLLETYDGVELLQQYLKTIKPKGEMPSNMEKLFQEYVRQLREDLAKAVELGDAKLMSPFNALDTVLLRALRTAKEQFLDADHKTLLSPEQSRELEVLKNQMSALLELPQSKGAPTTDFLKGLTEIKKSLHELITRFQKAGVENTSEERIIVSAQKLVEQIAQASSRSESEGGIRTHLKEFLGQLAEMEQQTQGRFAGSDSVRSVRASLANVLAFSQASGIPQNPSEQAIEEVLETLFMAANLPAGKTSELRAVSQNSNLVLPEMMGILKQLNLDSAALPEVKGVFEILLSFQTQIAQRAGAGSEDVSTLIPQLMQRLAHISEESAEVQRRELKQFLKDFSSSAKEKILSAINPDLNAKRLEQLKKVERILRSQEILDQLNPILKASGDPVLLLFPNIIQGFLSTIEVTLHPPVETVDDHGEGSQRKRESKQTHATLKVELPKFGKLLVDLHHGDKRLSMEFTFERQAVKSFVDSKLGVLKKALQAHGLEEVNLFTRVGTVNTNAPEWVTSLTHDGIHI
ncbi:MAG: flagellar hook-length control protein FliK [Bdellovibrionales bacterium]|nr:flagellar hook-length control protein FliK [Bdellovibrionales bacterium]